VSLRSPYIKNYNPTGYNKKEIVIVLLLKTLKKQCDQINLLLLPGIVTLFSAYV